MFFCLTIFLSLLYLTVNSTKNVRTLQANNRSLAASLEKLRQNLRQVHDHHTYLLKKNHELSEKILVLERNTHLSPSYIEEEVEKRFQVFIFLNVLSIVIILLTLILILVSRHFSLI